MTDHSVLLIEPHWRGHIPTYVQAITEGFLTRQARVTIACPDPDAVMVGATIGDHTDRLRRIKIQDVEDNAGSRAQGAKVFWNAVAAAVQKDREMGQSNRVYLDLLDPGVRSLSGMWMARRYLPKSWSGLYMHPVHRSQVTYPRQLHRLRMLSERLLLAPSCRHILTLDEGVQDELSRWWGRPVHHFPDITNFEFCSDTDHETRLLPVKIPQGKRVIGVLGLQARWKGVFHAIEVAGHMVNQELHWVFAGPMEMNDRDQAIYLAELRSLNERGVSVSVLHERIPDGEIYNSIVQRCDLLWAVYPGHVHSSNTMVKAAFFHKPCVVANVGLMAERALRYNLGTITDGTVRGTVAAVREALAPTDRRSSDLRDLFLSMHDEAALDRAIEVILSE